MRHNRASLNALITRIHDVVQYTLQIKTGLIDLNRQLMANSVNPVLPPVQDHNCPDVNDIYCGIQCNYLKSTRIVLKLITSL